jgi:hypothetical protein
VRETRSLVPRACLGPKLHYEIRLDEDFKDFFLPRKAVLV